MSICSLRRMPRPSCKRRIGFVPQVTYFKPAGVPMRALEEITLTLDELEALRLADFNGLYQEQAAEQMGISRATFARLIESARKKVADALLHGKALRVEGGPVVMSGEPNMNADQLRAQSGLTLGRGPCRCRTRRGRCRGSKRGTAHAWCICTGCGKRMPHIPGEACTKKICPKCGSPMTCEG